MDFHSEHAAKYRCGALVLPLLGLLLFPATAVSQTYIGKICLTSTVTERQTGPVSPESFVSQYDVTHLGGSSYAVVGSVAIVDEPFVTTGFGTVIGNNLHLNMTGTQSHAAGSDPRSNNWRDTGVNRTQLSLATLSGTFYEIGHDYNPVTRNWDTTRYTAGTVARTTCP